jgi:hypothetical protein
MPKKIAPNIPLHGERQIEKEVNEKELLTICQYTPLLLNRSI